MEESDSVKIEEYDPIFKFCEQVKKNHSTSEISKGASGSSSAEESSFSANLLKGIFENIKDKSIKIEYEKVSRKIDHDKKPFQKSYFDQRTLIHSKTSRNCAEIYELLPDCYEYNRQRLGSPLSGFAFEFI